MPNANDWNALCHLLCPHDTSLCDEVQLARSDRQAYFTKFEDQQWERCIEDASQITPWLALVDGLAGRACLHEFDWRLEAAETAAQLARLPVARTHAVDFSSLAQSADKGEALLHLAASILEPYGLRLLQLDIDSDSYPLTIVTQDTAAAVKSLAEALEQQVVIYTD